MTYEEFLKTKELEKIEAGIDVDKSKLNKALFPFQKDIVAWALLKGKAAIFSDCGTGKGQPYGSKVLTDEGWIEIQNLKIGMKAVSSNGKSYPIVGVFPKEEIDTYRFYYSDNTSLVFDKDHIHIVRTANDKARNKPWRNMTTIELINSGNIRYGKDNKSCNYDIPVVNPVEYEKKDYMISPYILGVLIGDGCLRTQGVITNPDSEVIQRVMSELPEGIELEQKSTSDIEWKIKTGLSSSKRHPFRAELVRLGIWGKLSHEKFIPIEYKYGSIEQRVDLLRGLMDTDGWIQDGQTFTTTSEQLKDDVIDLIRSLGGIPTCTQKKAGYKKDGEYIPCKDSYNIWFSLKTYNPFYLKRKADKWNPNPRDNGRWIDRIEYEKKQKTVCISVDSPDHSYVTENYTVTHNTIMQLEFANQIHKATMKNGLVVAPLAVVKQTKKEGKKFGIEVNVCRTQDDVKSGINITNYEMLEHFEADGFNCIVLDESSILKSFTSATRNLLIDMFQRVPYKLACTATPSPNDHSELGNHAEFLGIMSRSEMLATYFIHDGGNTSSWRLKGYGEKKFWEWVATWAVCVRNPSDLGYESEGYVLPELKLIEYMTESQADEGMLVAKMAQTLSERREARKKSLNDRVDKVKELIEGSDEHWLVWCDYNLESEILHREIKDSVEVVGSDTPEYKAEMAMRFADDEIKALVSKPSIYGFGMNFQNCHNIVFCGISDSYEQFYQAIRRCWRYGQKHPVNVHIVLSESEKAVLDNIKRKQSQMDDLQESMVNLMHDVTMSEIKHTTRIVTEYAPEKEIEIKVS